MAENSCRIMARQCLVRCIIRIYDDIMPDKAAAQFREVSKPVPMDYKTVEGIADAHPPCLGIRDYRHTFSHIPRLVEIGMADTGSGLYYGNLRILSDIVDKASAASRDNKIDLTCIVEQQGRGLSGWRKEIHCILIRTAFRQSPLYQGDYRGIRRRGIRAALQDTGVS